MKKNAEGISNAWANESRVYWTGKHYRFDHDHLIPRMIVGIDELMDEIAKSRGDHFRLGKGLWGRKVIKCSPLARALIECARTCDLHLIRNYLSRHKFSPYFEAFERHWWKIRQLQFSIGNPDHVHELNGWMHELRAELKASPFGRLVKNQKRAANKNAASMRAFIAAMFRNRAKVLVIRVDLGYTHEPDDKSVAWEPPPDELVKEQLQKWFRHVRSTVPGDPRIIWKLEWGAVKGHHVHAMILCRGSLVREGISWGKSVGEAWLEITGGAGSYWNCNANEAAFQSIGRRGIGLITYDDELGRKNLLEAAMYMVKSDVYARFVSPAFRRTFGKSKCEDRNEKRGRPRKYVDPVEDSAEAA